MHAIKVRAMTGSNTMSTTEDNGEFLKYFESGCTKQVVIASDRKAMAKNAAQNITLYIYYSPEQGVGT